MAQATIVETRKLGEQERLFHYLHMIGGLIATGCSHIRGPLTPELLRRGFNWLQRNHPVLNSHIRYEGRVYRWVPPFAYPQPWFDTRGTTEVPIRVVNDVDPEAWLAFRNRMYGGDFVFNVSREFVRTCKTPMLVLLGNDRYHPSVTSREIVELAPDAELVEHWKEPEVIEQTVERVRSFLALHTPQQ